MKPKMIVLPPAIGANKNATSSYKDELFETGHLCSVYIHYISCPSTTRIEILTSNGEEPCIPEEKMLDVVGNVSEWYYPRVPTCSIDGKKNGYYTKINVYGNIRVRMTKADPGSQAHVLMVLE